MSSPHGAGADVSLGEILGLDALALLKKPSFAIFIGCMFLICLPLSFYFVNLGIYLTQLEWRNMLVKTSLAQVSDIVFFLLLPLFLARFGYKRTILLGTALAGLVMDRYKLPTAVGGLDHDRASIWQLPAWGALVVLVVFALCFRNPQGKATPEPLA